MSKPLRIKTLEIESFKRIQFVRIVPEGSVTIIGGENRAGKSSALDAIEALFSGKGALPAEPIHRGKRRARIKAELCKGNEVELTVELELTASGAAKLTVLGPDGEPIAKPQTFLNSLFSDISFDPLAFARMDPKEQDKILRALDPETSKAVVDLDTKRAGLFSRRTDVNRDAKNLKAQFDGAQHHSDAPAEEVSVTDLAAELKRRQSAAEHGRELQRAAAATANRVTRCESDLETAKSAVAEAEKRLAQAREAVDKSRDELEAARANALEAGRQANEYACKDPAEIESQLSTVEATNRKVRANATRSKLESELGAKEREAERLSNEIESIDAAKANLLEQAKFPVPGLGFDELGPTYQGFPLDQASHSDRIKISAAIGMALHPQLGDLLIRDGEKVGTADMAMIRELAEREGFQVWIEKFTEKGEGCSVVLEDGRVRADQSAAE
jgi:DNA repair exonuclease SbcCD ATPase subunit